MQDSMLMEKVKRESRTEARIRGMDAHEIVEEIHDLEDRNEVLSAALENLLSCPAIADGDHSNPEWGCQESADAETIARAALTPHAL